MRAKLISWMMEVSSEFALRRETLHNAVIMLDKWLGKTENFSKNHLQLLALGCLFICSKIEELYPPTAANFAFTANNFFSEVEIKNIERNICKKLNWNLVQVTPNKVFGCLSQAWDNLISLKSEAKEISAEPSLLQFRQKSKESYHLFSEATQLLDCIICHPGYLQMSIDIFVLAVMQVVLCSRLSSLESAEEEIETIFGDFS